MNKILSNITIILFSPLLIYSASANDDFPFAPGILNGQNKPEVWSWQDVHTHRDLTIGNLDGATKVWEKDSAANPRLLGYPSDVENDKKTFETELDLTEVSGIFQVAIHVDDKATLIVKEIAAPDAPPGGSLISKTYDVDGTALWNDAKSYKEFHDYLPAGRKYKFHLTYRNIRNLTSEHPAGYVDFDGVNVFLVLMPMEIRQENYPTAGGANDATDLGTAYNEQVIVADKNAYITGQPAVPELKAHIKGASAALQVEWRLEIRTERPNLRRALDDRTLPAEGWIKLAGDQEWDITDAMRDEFVGGRCNLHCRINGDMNQMIPFFIRGKNPLDTNALAHINGNVGVDFQTYAWAMAKHESRQANQVYNQFNTQGGIEGTLNYGAPNGWGISQIDRPIDDVGVTTAEVWNWHQNIVAMNAKLLEKQANYRRFIGYFRTAYGNRANWSEPPAKHKIGNTTLPAEAWGVMVLYNGVAGVPRTQIPGRANRIRSPWVFNPNNGQWTFHDNRQNYASGRVRPELEGNLNSAE